MKCIVCLTYNAQAFTNFCSHSCATVYAIIISQRLVLTSEEMKKLALNRLRSLDDYMEY